jgi:T-complex protein 1 subunit epsilon
MMKEVKDARIAILACPFEPPKVKTKHSLTISNVEDYKTLASYERETFIKMIQDVKNCGANVVVCQWGFDDEANSLLMENDLPAVRWVGGHEIELIAVHTNGSIISQFEHLTGDDLGRGSIKELSMGTESDKLIIIESGEHNKPRAVTILVRGGTEMVIEEAKRSIRDALCAARNVLFCDRVVYGGGSCEVSSSVRLQKEAESYLGEEEAAILAYSKALEEIPLALAKNSGYEPVPCLSEVRKKQVIGGIHSIGVDCLEEGEDDMKTCGVFDSLSSKKLQLEMATQFASMILKIDDVVIGKDE